MIGHVFEGNRKITVWKLKINLDNLICKIDICVLESLFIFYSSQVNNNNTQVERVQLGKTLGYRPYRKNMLISKEGGMTMGPMANIARANI